MAYRSSMDGAPSADCAELTISLGRVASRALDTALGSIRRWYGLCRSCPLKSILGIYANLACGLDRSEGHGQGRSILPVSVDDYGKIPELCYLIPSCAAGAVLACVARSRSYWMAAALACGKFCQQLSEKYYRISDSGQFDVGKG
jgi:hypothetical protein